MFRPQKSVTARNAKQIHFLSKKKKKNLFFAEKPNIKMNKHVNKVRKATGRAEAITAGRQQNEQYLIIQLMKKKEITKTADRK